MKSPISRSLLALLPLSIICHSSPVILDPNGHFKEGEISNQAPIYEQENFASSPTAETPFRGRITEEHGLSSSMPSWFTSHLLARRLLALSRTGVLSTVFQHSDLAGLPIALPDYIADCANEEDSPLSSLLGAGNPLILALDVGTTYQNVKDGSNISLSLDWWHYHNPDDDGEQDQVVSRAGLPRLSLIGTLERLPMTMSLGTGELIEKCFLDAHPDAIYWLPEHPSPHSGYWARLVVHEAFWVGGFGDRAHIGWLDTDTWKEVRRNGKDGERGWGDVRLPGERK